MLFAIFKVAAENKRIHSIKYKVMIEDSLYGDKPL